MALAASVGSFAATLTLPAVIARSPRVGNALKPYMEMHGTYSDSRLRVPLRVEEGLGSM
jgi:hypothetical protein